MHIVIYQKHRDAACRDVPDQLAEPFHLGQRQTSRRLIEQDRARLAGKRARKLEQTSFAEAQGRNVVMKPMVQTDKRYQVTSTAPCLHFLLADAATSAQDIEQASAEARLPAQPICYR